MLDAVDADLICEEMTAAPGVTTPGTDQWIRRYGDILTVKALACDGGTYVINGDTLISTDDTFGDPFMLTCNYQTQNIELWTDSDGNGVYDTMQTDALVSIGCYGMLTYEKVKCITSRSYTQMNRPEDWTDGVFIRCLFHLGLFRVFR